MDSQSFTLITSVNFKKCWLVASLLCNSSYDLLKNYKVTDITLDIWETNLFHLQNHSIEDISILPFFTHEKFSFSIENLLFGPLETSFLLVIVPCLTPSIMVGPRGTIFQKNKKKKTTPYPPLIGPVSHLTWTSPSQDVWGIGEWGPKM